MVARPTVTTTVAAGAHEGHDLGEQVGPAFLSMVTLKRPFDVAVNHTLAKVAEPSLSSGRPIVGSIAPLQLRLAAR